MKRIFFATIIILLAGGLFWLFFQNEESEEVLQPQVTLTQYGDFQCPSCAAFLPMIKELQVLHGEKLKYEFKHFPNERTHPLSVSAAMASEAAKQQDKFYEYHDILFENQKEWYQSENPETYFLEYARQIGLNEDEFSVDSIATSTMELVLKEKQEAEDLGARVVPTFYLDNEQITFSTKEAFYSQVEQAISNLDGTQQESFLPQ